MPAVVVLLGVAVLLREALRKVIFEVLGFVPASRPPSLCLVSVSLFNFYLFSERVKGGDTLAFKRSPRFDLLSLL